MYLSHEKRRNIRTMIANLTKSQSQIEKHLRKNTQPSPALVQSLHNLTQTMDPENQLEALEAIINEVKQNYYEQLRQLAPDDLTAYAEYINPDEPPAPHHVWLCEKLMEMEAGEIPRMTISMPPGHAKSTYASRIFPSWYMGRHPKHKYIQAGHTTNFCENEFGKKTKAIIDSDAFRLVFPNVNLATDAKAAGYWMLAQHGGSYLTRGVGQGIAGFRANIAGVDDPFATREDAESQTIRDKVWDWFSADFSTRLLPAAPMFIVATRWHSDDLCGRVEDMNKKGLGDPWEIINLPAICTDIDDAMGRPIGEPLWPDFYTIKELMNKKATLPSRDWNSLYQGKPVDEEGGVILGAWLQRYDKLPEKKDIKRVTVSVDSANKDNERADFTAIGVWIETLEGRHYLAHVDRDRLELPGLIKRVETIARLWNATTILIEDKGSGTQYIQMRSLKAPCPVIPMRPDNNSKQFRLDGVAPMFEGGRVAIPNKGLWVPDYESELLGFPTAKYDDQVDMTSQYLDWARAKGKRGNAPLKGLGVANASKTSSALIQKIEKMIEGIAAQHDEDPIVMALRQQESETD